MIQGGASTGTDGGHSARLHAAHARPLAAAPNRERQPKSGTSSFQKFHFMQGKGSATKFFMGSNGVVSDLFNFAPILNPLCHDYIAVHGAA